MTFRWSGNLPGTSTPPTAGAYGITSLLGFGSGLGTRTALIATSAVVLSCASIASSATAPTGVCSSSGAAVVVPPAVIVLPTPGTPFSSGPTAPALAGAPSSTRLVGSSTAGVRSWSPGTVTVGPPGRTLLAGAT